MKDISCNSCLFWNMNDDHMYGRCFRYPPKTFLSESDKFSYRYPLVTFDSYCGEWKRDTRPFINDLVEDCIKTMLINGIRPIRRDQIAKKCNTSLKAVSQSMAWKAYKAGHFDYLDYLKKGK